MSARLSTTYDAVADQCAAAYADNDTATGDRLLNELIADHLRSDMEYWLPRIVWDKTIYDDVYARILVRFFNSFRAGKPVLRGYLRSIYKWTVADVSDSRNKYNAKEEALFDDSVLVEQVFRQARDFVSETVEESETSKAHKAAFDAVERHFAEIGKDQWVTIIRNHRAGEFSDTVIANSIDVRRSIIGQQKKLMHAYLAGPGRRYLEHLRTPGAIA